MEGKRQRDLPALLVELISRKKSENHPTTFKKDLWLLHASPAVELLLAATPQYILT